MYMEFPFQIFQTPDHIAMTFEWSQVHRTIYTNGAPAPDGIDFWMGDSRGRWEGDTLVVDVRNHNDRTWFDMAGNFHSEALHLVERYTMRDAEHDHLRGDDRGSEGLHEAVDDQHARCIARPTRIASSSISVRPRPKRPTARSSRIRRRGIPGPSVAVQTPAEWKDVQTPWKAPAPNGRDQAHWRTASRICRATSCPTAAAPTTASASTNRTS